MYGQPLWLPHTGQAQDQPVPPETPKNQDFSWQDAKIYSGLLLFFVFINRDAAPDLCPVLSLFAALE